MLRALLLAGPLLAAAPAAPTLSARQGSVAVQRAGAGAWSEAALGAALAPGDRLRAAAGARAGVDFADGSRAQLGPGSVLLLEEAAGARVVLGLSVGSLRLRVPQDPSRLLAVRTPTASLAVRGAESAVQVDARGRTSLTVRSGAVAVTDASGDEAVLRAGESLRVTEQGMPESVAQKAWLRYHATDGRFSLALPPDLAFAPQPGGLAGWHDASRDLLFSIAEVSEMEARRFNASAEQAARELARGRPVRPGQPPPAPDCRTFASGLAFHHVVAAAGDAGGRDRAVLGYFALGGRLYRVAGSLLQESWGGRLSRQYAILGTVRAEDPAAPRAAPRPGPIPAPDSLQGPPVPLLR